MTERKVFADSITPLPQGTGSTSMGLMLSPIEPHHKDEEMTLLFSLAIPPDQQRQIEARVAKGEVIPAAELDKQFASNPAHLKSLVAWLRSHGFDVAHQTSDGTSVYARASVRQIEKALA